VGDSDAIVDPFVDLVLVPTHGTICGARIKLNARWELTFPLQTPDACVNVSCAPANLTAADNLSLLQCISLAALIKLRNSF